MAFRSVALLAAIIVLLLSGNTHATIPSATSLPLSDPVALDETGRRNLTSRGVESIWSAAWAAPVNVSNQVGQSWGAKLALDTQGTLHAVWAHVDNSAAHPTFESEIFYAEKPAGGSWSRPINLSHLEPQVLPGYNPVVVVADQTVTVFWTTGSALIAASRSSSGVWSQLEVLASDSVRWFNVNVGGDGTFHLLWISGYYVVYCGIPAASAMACPSTIQVSGRLPHYWGSQAYLFVDAQNNVSAVWYDGDSIQSSDKLPSATWSSVVTLTNQAAWVSLAADGQGKIHAFWAYGDVKYSSKPIGLAAQWSLAETVPVPKYTYLYPPSVDSGGTLYAAWTSLCSTDWPNVVTIKRLPSGAWFGPTCVVNGDVISFAAPPFVQSSDGTLSLIWRMYTPGRYGYPQIFAASALPDGSWTSPTLVSHTGKSVGLVTARSDAYGNTHVIWEQDQADSTNILYSVAPGTPGQRSPPPAAPQMVTFEIDQLGFDPSDPKRVLALVHTPAGTPPVHARKWGLIEGRYSSATDTIVWTVLSWPSQWQSETPSLSLRAVVVSPVDPRVIVVAGSRVTWQQGGGYNVAGGVIFKSSDGGRTFSLLQGQGLNDLKSITFSSDGATLYSPSDPSVKVDTGTGRVSYWPHGSLPFPCSLNWDRILISPSQPSRMYVMNEGGSYYCVSSDYGDSWSPVDLPGWATDGLAVASNGITDTVFAVSRVMIDEDFDQDDLHWFRQLPQEGGYLADFPVNIESRWKRSGIVDMVVDASQSTATVYLAGVTLINNRLIGPFVIYGGTDKASWRTLPLDGLPPEVGIAQLGLLQAPDSKRVLIASFTSYGLYTYRLGTGASGVWVNETPPKDLIPAQTLGITWTARTNMTTARVGFGLAAALNGKMYAVGGVGGLWIADPSWYTLADVEEYDPASDTWTARASMPTRRSHLAVASANGKIYAAGGIGRNTGMLSAFEEYDPRANAWTVRASLLTARWGLALAAASNGKLYAVGGANDTGTLRTVEEYDPATNGWRTRAPMPTPRSNLALVTASNGKLYAIGGENYTGIVATVEEYDPKADVWRAKTSMPNRRSYFGAAEANGKIYVVGGYGYASLADVEEYDAATDTWKAVTALPYARGGLSVAVAANSKLYAVGGRDWFYQLLDRVDEATLPPPNRIFLPIVQRN